ncbi:MAG: ATP-binding protein [Patescibacteria group bacterium]
MMNNKLWTKTISTFRGRLVLWYLTSVGLIILLFFIAVSGLFWATFQNQIDHHIHIVVNEAYQIVQSYHGQERDTLIKNLVSAQGMTVIVLSPDGAPILETNSPDVALITEHQLQKLLTSSSLHSSTPTHFTESNIRFAARPVQVNAGKGVVAVGYSTRILYATFYKMLGIAIAVIIFLVFPITFLGYRSLKKQLHPLESIADQAKSITDTSSLSQRINITSATQELNTIQEALNTMLKRLEKIFKSEREFFSDAAHTLKTPLAVLRSQLENTAITQKLRGELIKTVDTTNDTIQDLLFLSQLGRISQSIEVFSLSTVMANLSELAMTLGEDSRIKVVSDIQSDVQFKADKKLLQRALSNIVHNAIVHNQSGGTISLNLIKKSKHIIIVIQDTGIGISERDLPKVFTRFFRGSNAKNQGSGLGLAISKIVIENCGGKMILESKINEGTTVTITL